MFSIQLMYHLYNNAAHSIKNMIFMNINIFITESKKNSIYYVPLNDNTVYKMSPYSTVITQQFYFHTTIVQQ